jgi:hypothetical protein
VGNNGDGQCNVGTWTNIDQVAAGRDHTVGVTSSGIVVAVGNNDFGQCGEGVLQTIDGGGVIDALTEADTEVVVNGTATVIIYKVDSSLHALSGDGVPGSPDLLVEEPYEKLDKDIVDVSASDILPGTEFEIRLYYTETEAEGFEEGTLRLFWKNGDDWIRCSPDSENSGDEPTDKIENGKHYIGYMWTKIEATGTSPTVGDLDGTEFGGYGHPSEPGGISCGMATLADVTPFALVSVGILVVWATKRKGKVS